MTSLTAVKLVRDLRAAWSRFALMVVAIAVSLAVFGAALLAWGILGRETRSAYLGTAPASATILLAHPLAAVQIAAVAADAQDRPGVLQATARTQFTSAVTVGDRVRDVPLQVFVAAPRDPGPRAPRPPPPGPGGRPAARPGRRRGGGAALLLSAILVASMLNGLFTQQIPQIGIMKAIGARSTRIGLLYLTMALLVALAATGVGLVLAVPAGRALAQQVLGFLGIRADSLGPPGWGLAVILAAGLLVPPAMALVPLVRASRTSVRAAIDHHGLGSRVGAGSGLLAWLSRVPRLDRGLLMAVRNTLRRPARLLLSVGLLASAGAVFVTGASLSTAVAAVAQEQQAHRSWDVEVALDAPLAPDRLAALARQVPGVGRVEGWTVARAGVAGPGELPVTRTYPDQGHGSVAVLGLPSGGTAMAPPTLLEGRWLEPEETGGLVLNQVARANTVPDLGVGDAVSLVVGGAATSWRVVGIAQERGGGAGGVYATAAGLAAATGQPAQVNRLRITTTEHDEATRAAVADAVEETLAQAGVAVASAASVSRSEAITEGHLGPIILLVIVIAVALGVVGTIGLASTMSANVLERTREFGIMHAVGASAGAVRRIVVAEGVLLALASCVVAVVPALALTAVLGAGLGNLFMDAPLPYRIAPVAALLWPALVTLGAVLATESAATRASRLTVREALAHL